MIIARSPLRITLGGGGTDLPSYYGEHEGFLVAAAINKYVYVSTHHSYNPEMVLRYSSIERVKTVQDIQHPIIRECMKLMNIDDPRIEITSMADIPAGTGLGSSGSFTTALLKAFHKYKMHFTTPDRLAELACHVELDLLKEPIGKQDQYIAAFGGLTCFEFRKDGQVETRPLAITDQTLTTLQDNLLLFSTGIVRSASGVLKEQDVKTTQKDPEMISNLHYVKDLGRRSCEALEKGNLFHFAELMHEHWLHKKKRSTSMSNNHIDELYEFGRRHGALGGKVIGAGGGGFLMFYTDEPFRLREAMTERGVQEMRFGFDFEGTKLIT